MLSSAKCIAAPVLTTSLAGAPPEFKLLHLGQLHHVQSVARKIASTLTPASSHVAERTLAEASCDKISKLVILTSVSSSEANA